MSSADHDDEASGHERWIISYADLVTLLFAFFTVMYSISVVNISKYKVVSESVSVAMGGKERTRTYPALTQEPLDPMNPQRDFINDIAFAVQPSRGDMPDRELLLSRIALLNQQQQSLALYIKPDSTLHNAITKPSNMQRIDAKAVLTKFGDHLLIVQNNLLDSQELLKNIFTQEDTEKMRLLSELETLKLGLTNSQTDITRFKDTVQVLTNENLKLVNSLRSSNQQVEELRSVKPTLLNGYQERSNILNQLQKIMGNDGVIVEIDLKNGILRLPEALLFGSGRADFSSNGKKAIAILARNLLKILPCYASREDVSVDYSGCTDVAAHYHLESVLIEGHTDALPISNGEFKDNWDLSFRRAKNTFYEVNQSQPKIEGLNNSNRQPLLSFSSYAGRRPIATNKTEVGRKQNRRIDLRFIMTPFQLQSDSELTRLDVGMIPGRCVNVS